jgi:hypothetical protein
LFQDIRQTSESKPTLVTMPTIFPESKLLTWTSFYHNVRAASLIFAVKRIPTSG